MKKRFIVILSVIVIIVILSIFKPLIFPSLKEEQEPLRGTVEETLREFERIYHKKIKLVYVNMLTMHGPLSEEKANILLEENLLVKERLSTNTYPLDDGFQYVNGEFVKNPDVRENTIKELLAAKNAGMSISLVSSWWTPEGDPQFKNIKEVKEFLNEYADILVEEAKFAEDYKVEYFELYEPDHLVWHQPFSVDEDTVAVIVNEFKENVVPRIRKVYKGKIGYQIGNAGDWNFTKLNVSCLDYFGVLIGGMCDFDMFKQKVDEIFSKAEQLSKSSGVQWVISELWINKVYDEEGNSCDLTDKRSKYYEYVFEKARASKNLKGIMIDTWNVDEPGFETSVKDTPSEQTIKNFFENWN
ncbi:MAG: hypothetical protein DRP10_01285 [Candidatus Aenigmatarchaeota archaeon]|nr:MAG: hypothetical protein DRP10_01285 [Candidatus Aenigmarchaeota archaeon]